MSVTLGRPVVQRECRSLGQTVHAHSSRQRQLHVFLLPDTSDSHTAVYLVDISHELSPVIRRSCDALQFATCTAVRHSKQVDFFLLFCPSEVSDS
jgi:hypothetical protein